MFVNTYTLCFVLSCVVFDAYSDGNEQNYLEKKVYAIESSLEADMHFLRKEVKANTKQMTKLVDLLNNTIQLVNSRSENGIVNEQPINSDDKSRGTMQHSDILQEIKKVASEASRNKRAIREEKQVAREVYSNLATSIETMQTNLQESTKRTELLLEKTVDKIENGISSKFDEIKIQNDEIRQEIKVNTDEIKKVASETIQNKRAILEVKQVSTDIYSKLATSNETLQTSSQESITRAELFQEKLVENLKNEIASKLDIIQVLNNAIHHEIKVNKDETEAIKTDLSLIKVVTVLDTLKINPFRYTHAVCNDTEQDILRCDNFIWFGNVINVSPLIPKDIRLSNLSEIPNGVQGRLEVYHSGEWGTVCDDMFDDAAASVACKYLGFAKGTAHGHLSAATGQPSAVFGQGVGNVWMDNVKCTGSESSLFQCPMNELGEQNCEHYEDVGVSCFS